jgi:copper transport protein
MVATEAVASAISYIALALLVGPIVVAGFLLPNGEPKELRHSLIDWALVFLLTFLGVSVLMLLIQGAKIQRDMPSPELLWRYLTVTQSGNLWIARETYGAALALFIWRFAKAETTSNAIRVLAVLTLPLVASRSLTSHAIAVREDTAVIVTADAIHLIGTTVWGGGLIALWRTLYLGWNRWNQPISWMAECVARFSRLALVSVAALIITGFYQSWVHVGNLGTLVNTDYGKVLMFKLSLLLVMLVFGALNFFSTKRMLASSAQQNDGSHSVRRKSLLRLGVESLIGLLIFCATGLLTVLPPGVHSVHQTAAAIAPPFPSPGHDSTKAYKPAEGASVKILSPKNDQVVAGDRVPLQFSVTRGKHGHHVHAYIDGELMGMFDGRNGMLNGIPPGRHWLELRVVAEDHQTELDASDRIDFMVK